MTDLLFEGGCSRSVTLSRHSLFQASKDCSLVAAAPLRVDGPRAVRPAAESELEKFFNLRRVPERLAIAGRLGAGWWALVTALLVCNVIFKEHSDLRPVSFPPKLLIELGLLEAIKALPCLHVGQDREEVVELLGREPDEFVEDQVMHVLAVFEGVVQLLQEEDVLESVLDLIFHLVPLVDGEPGVGSGEL